MDKPVRTLQSPEFALVAACCHWPLHEAALDTVRAAAIAVTNWPAVLRLAARHRVTGLVQQALSDAAVMVPADVARHLAAQAQSTSRLSLALVAETMRLQRAFDAADIAVLVLKGAVLAQLAYGSLSVKHSKDIDLLVAPGDVSRALRLLENNGYAPAFPAARLEGATLVAFLRYGREIKLMNNGLQVELKWKLADNPRLLQGIDVAAPAERVSLAGGAERGGPASVRTLCEADRFAYLSVHGAHHAWFRLKWLADFNALLAARSGDDIVRLYRHAQTVGAGLCAGQALLLCHRLLNRRLPPPLFVELRDNRRLRFLEALALGALADPLTATTTDSGWAGMTRGFLSRFLAGEGAAYFLAQWRIELVGTGDVAAYPLPPSLYLLYPAMRVPLWLVRCARRGLSRMTR